MTRAATLSGVLLAIAVGAACSERPSPTPSSPSAPVPTQATPPRAVQPGTVTFNGLTQNGAAFSSYDESGYTVRAASGSWSVFANYGNPRPAVVFHADGGSTVTGEIQVTAGGDTFTFKSIDLYASTTPIPYVITGSLNGATVFTLSDRLPNTYGQFRTVTNPNGGAAIDTLKVTLTNAAAPCCRNPMGVDNIDLR